MHDMTDELAAFVKGQLERITLKLAPRTPHASGPKRPTLGQQEFGER